MESESSALHGRKHQHHQVGHRLQKANPATRRSAPRRCQPGRSEEFALFMPGQEMPGSIHSRNPSGALINRPLPRSGDGALSLFIYTCRQQGKATP